MQSRQTEFWQELLRRLKSRQGQKTAAWLTRKLKVSPQTFSSWKARGQFQEELLPNVAELLPWQELDATLARKLGAELIAERERARGEKNDYHPIETALREVTKVYKTTVKAFTRYSDSTYTRVLSSLQDKCVFAFSGCMVTPFEFEDSAEGRAILPVLAKAICNGALCLYIRPTEEGLAYYEHTWGFAQIVHFGETIKQFDAFRQAIRRLMVRGEVKDTPKISPIAADRLLYERLDQCYVTRSPMWLPGIGLNLIGWNHERQYKARMAISLPGGEFGGPLIYPKNFPLEFRFTRFVRTVVADACLEIQARKGRRPSEGKVQLIMPEPEKHLDLIERFYTRYSELLRSVVGMEPQADALIWPDADRGQRIDQ